MDLRPPLLVPGQVGLLLRAQQLLPEDCKVRGLNLREGRVLDEGIRTGDDAEGLVQERRDLPAPVDLLVGAAQSVHGRLPGDVDGGSMVLVHVGHRGNRQELGRVVLGQFWVFWMIVSVSSQE